MERTGHDTQATTTTTNQPNQYGTQYVDAPVVACHYDMEMVKEVIAMAKMKKMCKKCKKPMSKCKCK